jgi:TusA-related sulfurtransferase
MVTIDTCGLSEYSPLIPAVKAMYTLPEGETIEVVMDNEEAFHDLKSYLSELGIGFREIYGDGRMSVQFTKKNHPTSL